MRLFCSSSWKTTILVYCTAFFCNCGYTAGMEHEAIEDQEKEERGEGTRVRLDELDAYASALLERLSELPTDGKATLLALSGDLGSGKTTLTQALARALGVVDPVLSPTYVLMRSYPLAHARWNKLVHIDAYRLDHPEQFAALAPDSFLTDPTVLAIVEWPERVVGTLPTPTFTLKLSADNCPDGERYIEGV